MSINPNDLNRTELEFPDGDEGRIYHDSDTISESDIILPSVTTVTGYMDDPGKDKAIGYWKQKYDGEDGSPYWKHLWEYSGPRGTIVHWYLQTHLTDANVGGSEETEALNWVSDHTKEYPYVYSIMKKHNSLDTLPDPHEYAMAFDQDDREDPVTLEDILWKDAHWALSEFSNMMVDMGLAASNYADSHYSTLQSYFQHGVRRSKILGIENYVLDTDVGYSGQYDLAYTKPNGDRVLADLKTSSKIDTIQYRMQAEAYARAMEFYPDELAIIQLQPDKRETQISWSDNWKHSRDELWDKFKELADDVSDIAGDIDV